MKVAWSKRPIMEVCHYFSRARRDAIDKLQMKSWSEGAYFLCQSLESLSVLLQRRAEEVLGTPAVRVEDEFRSSTPIPEVSEYFESLPFPEEVNGVVSVKEEPAEGSHGPLVVVPDDGGCAEAPTLSPEMKDGAVVTEEVEVVLEPGNNVVNVDVPGSGA